MPSPPDPEHRKAVPPDRHPHALLPYGQGCLDALLPASAPSWSRPGRRRCAALEEMRFVIGGHQLARASMGTSAILAGGPSSRATCVAACVSWHRSR